MCIITYVERQNESIDDWVHEFKYQMIEDVGNELGEQIDWLDSTISCAVENKSYSDLAALAMLRGWVEQEVQEMRDKL